MRTISNLATIFGICLFIAGCGMEDIPLICVAALIFGFGTAGVIKLEGGQDA